MKTTTTAAQQKITLIHKLDDGIEPGGSIRGCSTFSANPNGLLLGIREYKGYYAAAKERWGGIGMGSVRLMLGEHEITLEDMHDIIEDHSDRPAGHRKTRTARAAEYLAALSETQ